MFLCLLIDCRLNRFPLTQIPILTRDCDVDAVVVVTVVVTSRMVVAIVEFVTTHESAATIDHGEKDLGVGMTAGSLLYHRR